MLVELIEIFEVAERFRTVTDPEEVRRLGDRMGRMVFGDRCRELSVGATGPRASVST
jgi:hypothetical protein